jgi:hypothetical protein
MLCFISNISCWWYIFDKKYQLYSISLCSGERHLLWENDPISIRATDLNVRSIDETFVFLLSITPVLLHRIPCRMPWGCFTLLFISEYFIRTIEYIISSNTVFHDEGETSVEINDHRTIQEEREREWSNLVMSTNCDQDLNYQIFYTYLSMKLFWLIMHIG